MATTETVQLAVEDGVATITLNRPAVLNSLDMGTAEVVAAVVQRCRDDADIRALVLTGSGRGFCAGGDMKAAWEHMQSGGDLRVFFGELTFFLHRVVADLRAMEKPVIAAINGVAGGAGLSLAAACDFRIAADTAQFKQAYTSIGLVPDLGWTVTVPLLIGVAAATELLLHDPVLDAGRARAIGLVHEVVAANELMERARNLARRAVQERAGAFGAAKALLNAALFPAIETQLEKERRRLMNQATTAEYQAGLTGFIKGRASAGDASVKGRRRAADGGEGVGE